MSSAADWIRAAIAEQARAEADELLARALGHGGDEAARVSARARARLGTGAGREKLEEAVSERAFDDASHGALLDHVARIAEREVMARRGIPPFPAATERVVVDGRERSLSELAIEARDPIPERARAAVTALDLAVSRDRAARLEAAGEAVEQRARIRSRGPAPPDAAPTDLRERCAVFLDATDDAAADLVARAHHATGIARPTPTSLAQALAPPPLDGFVPPRSRSSRVTATVDALGLAGELRSRLALASSAALTATSRVVVATRVTVLTGAVEAGVSSERALLVGVGDALVRALASPSLPVEHRIAPRASIAQAMGAFFGAWLADERFVSCRLDATSAGRARIRVAATLGVVLEARHACAALVAGAPTERTDAEARERVARALGLDPSDVSPELARTSWTLPVDAETRVRALLAALSWASPLCDRYDEDLFRNPRLGDFVRGAAARGGSLGVEAVSAELGARPSGASERAVELAQRAGG